MDEYIKRSEVIDLVEKAIKKCSTEKTTKGVLVCAHLRTAVMGLRSADVAPRSEWISVEERLPDNGETVITVDNEGYMIVASWYELGGWFLPVCRANPVTHWMPLPEPPDMKGGAE